MAIDYKITERIAELGDRSGGWKLELNKVSWNGKAAKYDIRAWTSDHEDEQGNNPFNRRSECIICSTQRGAVKTNRKTTIYKVIR